MPLQCLTQRKSRAANVALVLEVVGVNMFASVPMGEHSRAVVGLELAYAACLARKAAGVERWILGVV
eukprot:scaffold330633_cov45-Prasinocladus_malaysianus.AAC.1